jgi:hypothetical protein
MTKAMPMIAAAIATMGILELSIPRPIEKHT